MAWNEVGLQLRAVLHDAVRRDSHVRVERKSEVLDVRQSTHLRLLCDDTGILQHTRGRVPSAEDGYCVDDAGRMLPIAAELAKGDAGWHTTAGRLLTYLNAATDVDPKLGMRNFMSWDRRWLDEPYQGDHVARAIWGLGELSATGPFASEAVDLADHLLAGAVETWPLHMIVYSALGVAAAHQTDGFDRAVDIFAQWLESRTAPRSVSWPWPEPRLRYDNGRIPEALIRLGALTNNTAMIDRGQSLLRWLDAICVVGAHYRLPGHLGVGPNEDVNLSGDEQPLEAVALADAHAALFDATGDAESLRSIERAASWYTGNNRLAVVMGDLESGRCYDGLGAIGPNRNGGAESTISFVRCSMRHHSTLARATLIGPSHEPVEFVLPAAAGATMS